MAFADLVRFNPVAGGTTDWVVSSAVGGCQLPSAANVLNGVAYKLYAVSTDLTQWEVVISVYNSGTTTFPRTTVLYNSSGTGTATGQSGAGTKINFSTIPQVSIVALAEDMVPQQPGQLPGTATNDSASAGNVGEFIISTVLVGAAVALTNAAGTIQTITSVGPTAGDWDGEGCIWSAIGTGNVTFWEVGMNTTTNVLPTRPATQSNGTIASSSNVGLTAPYQRFSLSTTTTVYIIVSATYTVSCSAYGFIALRRMR
jgi:hypothetical protein